MSLYSILQKSWDIRSLYFSKRQKDIRWKITDWYSLFKNWPLQYNILAIVEEEEDSDIILIMGIEQF